MSYNPTYSTTQSTGTSSGNVTNYENASAIDAIPQARACSVDSSGLIAPIDLSDPASWKAFVGYANVRIPESTTGPIISNGRLKNITTALPVGTALYIDTNGDPTNIAPSVGVNGFVSGDACIFIGVLVANEVTPSEVDIALFTQLIGRL